MTKEVKKDAGDLRRRIGRNVEMVRNLRGMSCAELGVRIGWSAKAVEAIEAGTSQLTIDDVARLAAALDVEAAWLMSRTADVIRADGRWRYPA